MSPPQPPPATPAFSAGHAGPAPAGSGLPSDASIERAGNRAHAMLTHRSTDGSLPMLDLSNFLSKTKEEFVACHATLLPGIQLSKRNLLRL